MIKKSFTIGNMFETRKIRALFFIDREVSKPAAMTSVDIVESYDNVTQNQW